jgi:catechol 2,3-dioxygenase-like lactoylglutathione lyase family enzyme
MDSGVAFDHVLIVVQDLERSIGFYELLGFSHVETIGRPMDRVGVMELGETKIELICLHEGRETHRPPRRLTDIGFRHLGFRVEDIDEVYDRLKDKIRFESPPTPMTGRAGRMTVFFADPDGVELHFVQA